MPDTETLPLPLEQTLDHILPSLRSLAVEMASLIPDPENSRRHDAANLKIIANSLLRYGQRSVLTVNRKTNYIQKGNGTYIAALLLGWKMIAVAWTDDERTESLAYGLIDNESSDSSVFDHTQKGRQLRELKAADYPLLQFFNEDEMVPYLHQEFQRAEITDEIFDPGLKKGRAISKISTSERATLDRAIALVRASSPKALQEGTALEMICSEYISLHLNELNNAVEEIAALSLED